MDAHGEIWRTLRRVITLVAILGGIHFLVVRPIERASAHVSHGVKEVLSSITGRETRVVEGGAEILRSDEISELALLDMRMSATRTIEKSENLSFLPLGTKKLVVRGYYQVKGGYRLQDQVSLRMENGRAIAKFPKAEVLSVELIDYETLGEDSGWLNKVQPADRAQILRELREQMRKEAERSGMLNSVEKNLRTRLRDLLGVETVELEHSLP